MVGSVVQSTLASFFGGDHTAEIVQLTAVAIMLVERETGKKWADDYFTRWHAKEAALQVVSSLFDANRPPVPDEIPELKDPHLTWRPDFGRSLGRTLVANQATSNDRSEED